MCKTEEDAASDMDLLEFFEQNNVLPLHLYVSLALKKKRFGEVDLVSVHNELFYGGCEKMYDFTGALV